MDIVYILTLLIAVIAIMLTLVCIVVLAMYYKKQKQDVYKLIRGQREMLENRVYEASKPLVSDAVFFEDTSRILIDTSNPDMKGASHVPDFSFFQNMDIDLSRIKVEENSVAVLMPFNSRFSRIYSTIRDACLKEGYSCYRSDDELVKDNTLLRRYIVDMILKSSVLVAVLDGRNANVYYEIGIAHAMGKLVLLVANVSSMPDIPVDFKANRLILYSNLNELRDSLQKTLRVIHHD